LSLSTFEWSVKISDGVKPSARSFHSYCITADVKESLLNPSMVVFGGYLNEGMFSNELFFFDLTDNKWS
jgi:hypothetical protein